jgi:hypothetical protein
MMVENDGNGEGDGGKLMCVMGTPWDSGAMVDAVAAVEAAGEDCTDA